MKALLIKQCKDHLMWYSKLVGCLVPYRTSDRDGYWSREPAGHSNVVWHRDAEPVEVPDGTPMYCRYQKPPTAAEVTAPLLKALQDRHGRY